LYREASKRHRQAYPEKKAVECNVRRRRHRAATPPWANKFFIKEIYELAQMRTSSTGIKWHVDHVIPLHGKRVCGLHIEDNLRVITAAQNLKKHNHYSYGEGR